MARMTLGPLKGVEKLRAAGVPEAQAKAKAEAWGEALGAAKATKRDVERLEARFEMRFEQIHGKLALVQGVLALVAPSEVLLFWVQFELERC